MRLSALLCLMLAALASTASLARDLRVATWNLGWHLSSQEARQWIAKCSGLFEQDQSTGIWHPTQGPNGTPGWELVWGRNHKNEWDNINLPPCDVYKSFSFDTVPVTDAAYTKRLVQITKIITTDLLPDIIAFEEVSGAAAVREILPQMGSDYDICSFTGFKVQRLAIAWRKELGEQVDCSTEALLSLPGLAVADRVRPGLSLGLRIDGKLIRILAVHLKSSCVSPLEARGKLASTEQPCTVLQRQIVPLETWIEGAAVGADGLIILGDFNRNLGQESHQTSPVRTDNSPPDGAIAAGVLVQDLFREVFDGVPVASAPRLLPEDCPITPAASAACSKSQTSLLLADELKMLQKSSALGCRNPVQLDHILVGGDLAAAKPATKVSLGVFGGTKPADQTHPDPLLAVSDHCPLIAELAL